MVAVSEHVDVDEENDLTTEEETVTSVVVGAWKEALNAEAGVERFILVSMVLVLTVPFLPVWVLLRILEIAGHYDVEGGFTL